MSSTAERILRVGVIRSGKIIEERLVGKRDHFTVGRDAGNTIVVPDATFPATLAIFEHRLNQYHLLFTEQMNGGVRVGNSDVDFSALRQQGLAKRRENVFVFPLTDSSKGKLSIGEVTLLFQLVPPPPEPVQTELPPNIRGSPFQTIDRLFWGIMAASLLFHFSGAACIAMSPKLQERELSLEELPDRFAKVFIPPKVDNGHVKDKPKPPGEEKKKDEKKEESAIRKVDHPGGDAASRKAAIATKVASKGLLKILGSQGNGGGSALADVLGSSTGSGDIATALAGAAGVGVAAQNSIGTGGPKGAASGSVTGIGVVGTSGGGKVSLAAKGDAAISGHVKDYAPEIESTDVDREALARYVRQRLKAIQICYERELKRNPSLKGRVVVRFIISRSGRPEQIDIEENSLNNDAVGSCIRAVIRGWSFPFRPADDVSVAYPFLFSPAS